MLRGTVRAAAVVAFAVGTAWGSFSSSARGATPVEQTLFGSGEPISSGLDSRLFRLSTSTGASTVVGDIAPYGSNALAFQGLTSDPREGSVRMWGVATNERLVGNMDENVLFSINPSTGVGTRIGDTGLPHTSVIDDIAYDTITDAMYGVSRDGKLYSVNPATAAVTPIGATGVGQWEGLGFNASGKLYGTAGLAGSGSSKLYLLDTLTGSASFVANLGSTISDLAVRPTDGVMFGVAANSQYQVVTIDTSTGGLTLVGDTGLVPIPTTPEISFRVLGAAFAPVVPEPGTAMLATLIGVGCLARRHRMPR